MIHFDASENIYFSLNNLLDKIKALCYYVSMNLKQYIKDFEISVASFAERSGVDRPVIYRAFAGCRINLRNALRIHKATDGKVTLEELADVEG